MKVREILAEVAQIAEGNSLSQGIKNRTESTDTYVREKLDVLLSCYNSVMREIATNYEETISSKTVYGNSADVSTNSDVFIKLLDVTDLNDQPIDYVFEGNTISVNEDRFKFTYRSVPVNKSVDDTSACSKKIIGYNVYVYGTLAEYCLRQNRIEEAQNWESKYRQAVEIRTDYKRRRLKAGKKWGL